MTIASTMHTECRQPAGIDRLAQRLGLALVAWSERSVSRPEFTRADLAMRHAAEQLLSERHDQRATLARRPF